MKKYVLPLVSRSFVRFSLFTIVSLCMKAQEPAPSSWNTFINSAENRIVSDTFRLQTFKDRVSDNWKYQKTDGSLLLEDIPALKLPSGSSASFEPYPLTGYGNVIINLHLARKSFAGDEKLMLEWLRDGVLCKADNVSIKDDPSNPNYFTQRITKNPTSVRILVSGSGSDAGYCLADSVYAYGDIPLYSLFTGRGGWNDTARWTHLPPLRHRNALINGALTVGTAIHCNRIALHKGSIHIDPGNRLEINDLHLHDGSPITSEGEIRIRHQITLHKTFEEKGKWYFISFPFNVYADQIDARFRQKDATPNNGGNFFYVLTYNGDKRARNNLPEGNWEVVPVRSGSIPVFEKNKGYLIALDEKAADRTLAFASKEGELPDDFAKNGTIPVIVSATRTNENEKNHGWYLCGNPLPAPLPLRQLKNSSALDGFVYLYREGAYETYPIDSDYALPPYSAFFIKASGETEMNVTIPPIATGRVLSSASSPVSIRQTDPIAAGIPSTSTIRIPQAKPYVIKNKMLYLENIGGNGSIELFDPAGKRIWTRTFRQDTRSLPLYVNPGIYLIRIRTKTVQIRDKIYVR